MKERNKRDILSYLPMTRDKFDPLGMIVSNPQGSYTGIPLDGKDYPVQDVDDL